MERGIVEFEQLKAAPAGQLARLARFLRLPSARAPKTRHARAVLANQVWARMLVPHDGRPHSLESIR